MANNKVHRIEGTPGNDTGRKSLIGSGEDDDIYGYGGDDELIGGAGDDWLFPGLGNNVVDGGPNNTSGARVGPIENLKTRAYIEGDLVSYFDSKDPVVISMSYGHGTAIRGRYTDTLDGIEKVRGSKFDDLIESENENHYYFTLPAQVLEGDAGDDIIRGGKGNDFIDGDTGGAKKGGDDKLYGLSGADTLYDSPGNDLLDGGDDYRDDFTFHLVDTAIFTRVVQVDLIEGVARHGKSVELDHVIEIEDVQVTPGSTVVGNDLGNEISTLAGSSKTPTTLHGGGGNDNLSVNRDSKTPAVLFGDDGDDTINAVFSGSKTTFFGGDGRDVMYGGIGSDTMYGGLGSDHFGVGSTIQAKSGRDFVMDFVQGEDSVGLGLGSLDTNGDGVLDVADKGVHVGEISADGHTALSMEVTLGKGSSVVLFGLITITLDPA